MVTKAGTNDWHGTAAFYERAAALNARFPIENPAPNPKQPFSRQNYVGTLGGPVARAHGTHPYQDFQFVQMTSPELAPPDWEPAFADYLYLAFTNASAFSPTDVMPLSRWAKLAMTLQSVISIITVALIVARAVNILK